MKQTLIIISLALAGCVVAQPAVVRTSSVRSVVTVDTFEPYLSPYGEWLYVPGYGRVWQPGLGVVGSNFYPYGTNGHWQLSDAGWVFASDLPFGWAVFHYGRWFRDPFRGWCWLPGDQWAPAWVSWRMGGPYIGWAPIGPFGAPQFHNHSWTFVEAQLFLGPNVYAYSLPPSRFHHAVALTEPLRGSVTGPPPAYVSRATNQQLAPVPIGRVQAGAPVPPPPPGQRVARMPSSMQLPPPPGRERPSLLPPPPRERAPGVQPPGLGRSTLPSQQLPQPPPPPGSSRSAPGTPPPPPGYSRGYPRAAPPQQRDVQRESATPLPPGAGQYRPTQPPASMAPPPPGYGRSAPSFQRDRERSATPPGQWRSPAPSAPPPPPPPGRRSSPAPRGPPPPPGFRR